MGMESLLASNDEKVMKSFLPLLQYISFTTRLNKKRMTIFALVITGSAYRGAYHSAQPIQKDEGGHGTHAG